MRKNVESALLMPKAVDIASEVILVAKLVIVRHAAVSVHFDVPSTEWDVTHEGVALTRHLAKDDAWNEVSEIYHSPERKAVVTANVLSEATGIPTTAIDGLRELKAPAIRSEIEFVRRVGSYLAGYPDTEFENWDAATARVVDAIQQAVSRSSGKSIAVVSHGRILTVWYSHLFSRRMTVDEWRSIRLPDLSVVDLDTWRVERGFFAE